MREEGNGRCIVRITSSGLAFLKQGKLLRGGTLDAGRFK